MKEFVGVATPTIGTSELIFREKDGPELKIEMESTELARLAMAALQHHLLNWRKTHKSDVVPTYPLKTISLSAMNTGICLTLNLENGTRLHLLAEVATMQLLATALVIHLPSTDGNWIQ